MKAVQLNRHGEPAEVRSLGRLGDLEYRRGGQQVHVGAATERPGSRRVNRRVRRQSSYRPGSISGVEHLTVDTIYETNDHSQMPCSEAEYLRRFSTFDPPPEGFDPLTASQSHLAQYGIPHRPHVDNEPRRYGLWRRIMERSPKLVKAELFVHHELRRSRRQAIPRASGSVVEGPYMQGHWAGASVFRTLPEPYSTVYAAWTVPTVQKLPTDVGYFPRSATCWVGLDGALLSNDVLQAGTASVLDQFGNPSYSAFFEWYPDPACPFQTENPSGGGCPVAVRSVPVDPGDRVNVLVCSAFKSTEGLIAIYNETTNQGSIVGINAPAGVTLSGISAECILETGYDPEISQVELADFGSVLFYDFLAGSQHHSTDFSGGTTYDISDGSNQLTRTELFEDGMTITWLSNG
jgi:hypothetical protein